MRFGTNGVCVCAAQISTLTSADIGACILAKRFVTRNPTWCVAVAATAADICCCRGELYYWRGRRDWCSGCQRKAEASPNCFTFWLLFRVYALCEIDWISLTASPYTNPLTIQSLQLITVLAIVQQNNYQLYSVDKSTIIHSSPINKGKQILNNISTHDCPEKIRLTL